MKNLIVVNQEKNISPHDINLIEKKLDISLPKEYQEHLALYNGGHPIKDSFPMLECIERDLQDREGGIAWFCALTNNEYNNFLKSFEIYKIWRKRMPYELVPIADDPYGNVICISVAGDNYGKVYFWDHNLEADEGEEVNYSNVYLVANNFADFINSLYKLELISDPDEEEVWQETHDKYSLPLSTKVREYGKVISEFFAKAPEEVEDYVLTTYDETGEMLLSYKVDSTSKSYFRHLSKEGKVLEEYIK